MLYLFRCWEFALLCFLFCLQFCVFILLVLHGFLLVLLVYVELDFVYI